ncbi:hypothetical protein CEXT_102591 [Caerostris extrusa]|uniref:Uncharacterized protein n=1 Tax=Caerostris extrusa TaxID=172846 RepID=A0AAV4TSM3_CAEEX|nr:hypothetical protein CEXT_102591 [Caerostris extrusa]
MRVGAVWCHFAPHSTPSTLRTYPRHLSSFAKGGNDLAVLGSDLRLLLTFSPFKCSSAPNDTSFRTKWLLAPRQSTDSSTQQSTITQRDTHTANGNSRMAADFSSDDCTA